MADHPKRILEQLRVEAETLRIAARRARQFDHRGNRGGEAEHAFRRWLRDLYAPDYSVSSGEVLDSFVNPDVLRRRQHDGIVHRNEIEANSFILPSGMRLVPIETVAAVVEVKLKLDEKEFFSSEVAATATSRLRWRVTARGSQLPTPPLGFGGLVTEDDEARGILADDPRLGGYRPVFAVFGFTGVRSLASLIEWVRASKIVSVVCCLDAGCVIRVRAPGVNLCSVAPRETALALFVQAMKGAMYSHKSLRSMLHVDFANYRPTDAVSVWDGVDDTTPPPWYTPLHGEAALRARVEAQLATSRRRPQRKARRGRPTKHKGGKP